MPRGEIALERTTSIAQVCIDVNVAARSSVNVLVTARSAQNRAAIARMIHAGSARCHGPFVAVCSPPPPTSIRPGIPDVDGWFERAAGGTLFIDQVGRLSPNAQATLLSRLTRETHRADRPTLSPANHQVRVIAGSDRSLRADLVMGLFSDELFYRLNAIHIDQTHQYDTAAAPPPRAFHVRHP